MHGFFTPKRLLQLLTRLISTLDKVLNSRDWLNIQNNLMHFLIAQLARSDPRNNLSSSVWISFCHLLIFSVFRHVFISSLDMFKNCINLYHIDSEQVQTCLRIAWIVTIYIILNLNKFRHVWTCSYMFENRMNHINLYHNYWFWTS